MIYEYQCRKCQEVFDAQMSLAEHDQGDPACPRCQSRDVVQRMTGFFAQTTRKAA
ncbi:FmdB family zinc ribbon protein [Candidatus Manganitrophus noduliformans]|uniref:Zinc ribbon domain-containing protein n=1 Tax=Candidatus Manganitrophus noduliformans TaxID=2606439 RepID=A0A7X6DRI2_9BACT|nr:zinc ribbon domain-containing protein [Candidatus Manganitrophus noduliformans]NKE72017.1 zinc ribbon domain-containing protein [Candidatus Manganitrophus noduliformans]